MKLKIIETEDYTLAVEVAFEYKINTLIVANDGSAIAKIVKIKIQHMLAIDVKTNNELAIAYHQVDDWSKITAYKSKGNTLELDLPLLPEIVVEDDVEKLAESCAKEAEGIDIPYQNGLFYGFIKGHKAATKVYSEDDLKKAYRAGFEQRGNPKPKACENFIQFIKQPKPKWFVAEKEKPSDSFRSWLKTLTEGNTILKTKTINGKEYLVGTYLYN